MGRIHKLGEITAKNEYIKNLKSLASSQTAERRQIQRVKIILLTGEVLSNAEISAKIAAHLNTVSTFIKKHIAASLQYASAILNVSEAQTSSLMKRRLLLQTHTFRT